MIKFGTWSVLLSLASLHGLAVAALLATARANRAANRCLALLLAVIVLMITPYTLGYAGFYDAWPWLSFAPLRWTLAIGPLMFGYVRQLGAATPWHDAWRHFLPAGAQGLYYVVVFAFPTEAKWAWDDAVHRPWIAPVETLAVDVSLAAWWFAAWRHASRYQRWLRDHSAAREDFQLRWLRGFLVAMGLFIVAAVAHQALDAAVGLSYADDFPLYAALALLVYVLGIEGWRHAHAAYPPMRDDDGPRDAARDDDTPAAHDWATLGRRWAERVAAEAWWREADLDLADLARRLGTNTQYLSRALNEGLGERYSDFVNRQRVDEAQRLLAGDGDVLAIAHAVGFGSKASFNRVFKARTGCTPSEYRQRLAAARTNA